METCLLSDPATQFHGFAGNLPEQSVLRQKITSVYRQAEPDAVAQLLTLAKMNPDTSQRTNALAVQIAQRLRDRKNAIGRAGLVQGLLQEYALSSKEGVALMCLAEALLRIPDAATRDALIRCAANPAVQGRVKSADGKAGLELDCCTMSSGM